MLNYILKAVFSLILSSPIAVIILAISNQPQTLESSKFELSHIQQLLIDNDPRLLLDAKNQTIRLSEKDVNALISYAKNSASSHFNDIQFLDIANTALQAELSSNLLILSGSSPIAKTPFGQHINFRLTGIAKGNTLHINSIKVGHIQIPSYLQQHALQLFRHQLTNNRNYQLFTTLTESITQLSLQDDNLAINLNWQKSTLNNIKEQARLAFISQEDAQRLIKYNTVLKDAISTIPIDVTTISLNHFLRAMFSAAYHNSETGLNPIAENRAAFITLTAYLTPIKLELLTGPHPSSNEFNQLRKIKTVVEKRQDLAQHIIGSAAISASAGANIANILSIYKEVHDSRYRTGFSFSDITANETGTILGTLATQTPEHARYLQRLLMSISAETDYMPLVHKIDGLTEKQFIALYESRSSTRYKQQLSSIRHKISQRPLMLAMEQLNPPQ